MPCPGAWSRGVHGPVDRNGGVSLWVTPGTTRQRRGGGYASFPPEPGPLRERLSHLCALFKLLKW